MNNDIQESLERYLVGLNEPNATITFRKGEYGEFIVDQIINEWFPHHHIMKVINRNTAHLIDRLLVPEPTLPHLKNIMLEVKTKSRRSFYKDTGVNEHNYWRLISNQCLAGNTAFLAFVDEGMGAIYGNFLDDLREVCEVQHPFGPVKYPLFEMGRTKGPAGKQSLVYFPIKKMGFCRKLDTKYVNRLRQLATRNEKYPYPSATCSDVEVSV